jgi:hypothetical protein
MDYNEFCEVYEKALRSQNWTVCQDAVGYRIGTVRLEARGCPEEARPLIELEMKDLRVKASVLEANIESAEKVGAVA